MKCSEIVPHVMEQISLRKQSHAHQQAVNAGGKTIPNCPLKKRRKPINGPVLMTFSLPQREILMGDAEASEK